MTGPMSNMFPATAPVMSSSTSPMMAKASPFASNVGKAMGTAPIKPTAPGAYTGPVSAGNGTYGNMGTGLSTPAQGVPGVSSGKAYNPNVSPSTFTPATSPDSAQLPDYGTNSGPGIMQQWFNERATGTDPGWEYATKRGLTALDNEAAARGGYNSGAAEQGDRDFMANALSQREGQLDTLAGGASNEYDRNLATMLGMGMGLAGGQAGLGGTYDVAGANAMSGANNAGLQYGAQSAMIPYMANQNFMNQAFGLGGAWALA